MEATSYDLKELRLWIYACPFIAFSLANFYTYAGAPMNRQFDDFLMFFMPIALIGFPLILPLRSGRNLPAIIVMLGAETMILTFSREWAQFGHTPFDDSNVWLSALLASGTMALPLLIGAIKSTVVETIRQKKAGRPQKDRPASDSTNLS